ncbi:MAG: alkaline phosphatase family protein [Treponema sp.]|nr:alkaline phosphatase family protein [Treponema sp.]
MKFRIFIIILFLSILFFSCSSTPMPRLGSVTVPNDFLGFVHAGHSGTTEEFQLLDEMGAVWLLHTFYWWEIEREQGNFNFTWYDNFVNSAKENNKKVIACIAYDTDWIRTGKKTHYISPDDIPHFLNFIEVLINRYKGKVDVWQIWNEPNWIFWKGSDREFYELTRQAAQKIREVDPDAYIIGGGLWRTPKGFIRGMHKAGAFENVDAISFHPYAVNPRGSMKLFDSFIKIMDEINFTGDIWITEVGYPTSGWYPTKVSLDNLSSHVIKTIAGAAARGARTLIWYEFSDPHNYGENPNTRDSEMYFGLTYPNRTRKNGGWAYELCGRFIQGSQYIPQLPVRNNIPSSIISFYFRNNETDINTLILWNDRNRTQNIRVSLSSSFTLHNITNGTSVLLPDNSILEINNEPSFITWHGDTVPNIFSSSSSASIPVSSNIENINEIDYAKHLVFIGMDGFGGYYVKNANMPVLKQMVSGGASSLDVKNHLPSDSMTNWNIMFRGTPPDKQTINNFPSIFSIINNSNIDNSTFSIFHEWSELKNIFSHDNIEWFYISSSLESTNIIANHIIENTPAITVIVYDELDTIGHQNRWGSKAYYEMLALYDNFLAIIIQAVKDAGIYDETVFVVSSDHGGFGYGHQLNIRRNRRIPLVFYGKGIKNNYRITSDVNIMDIAPTMALSLGLEIPSIWDGLPILEIFEINSNLR